MKKIKIILCCLLCAFFVDFAFSSETNEVNQARLVNGVVVEGAVVEVSVSGIVVQTTKGNVSYPWKHLSLATRYRYQPDFDLRN